MASSPYFNNPAFAQAAANLSSLFSPPSGADAAGWATANSKNAEAARLAELFSYAKNPNYDQKMFDRLGMGAGAWNPTQSFYKVGVDDARSGANNAADNARALEQTRMQGATELEKTKLAGQNELAKLYASPVAVNQGQTVYLPEQTSAGASLPRVLGGNIAVNQGERVVTPDGRTIEGATKPLSTDEVAAAAMGEQLKSGAITPQQVIGPKLGTPVEAIGPNGQPVFMAPGQAMATGAQAYVKPDAGQKPTNGLAVMKDGSKIPAIQGPDGVWRAAQNGASIPPDGLAMVVALPTLQGSEADLGMRKTTEAQDRAGYAGKMSEDATNAVIKAFDTGALPNGLDFQAFSLLRNAPAALAPAIVSQMSPAGQLFYQNIRSALPYQLMAQSGQAVTEQEYERKLLELVPVPGEDPAVSAAKKRQFVAYGAAIQGMAGPAAAKVGGLNFNTPPNTPVPQAAPAPAPQAAPPAAAAPAVAPGPAVPAGAIDLLRKNPALAPKFDQKYGPGAAERILKGG